MICKTYWKADQSICVIQFETPVETLGQAPFNAVNHALDVFYHMSAVCDPFPMTIWSDELTQWGIMVSESMNLTDQQAYELAKSVVDRYQPQPSPFDVKEFSF